MKRLIAGLIFGTASLFATTSFADTQTYTIDPNHSYVEWHINHLGFSNPSGKWYVNGTLQIDKANPQNSKVNVTIDVKTLVTGLPKLDEHLSSADFFDIAKYPTATFVSTKVVPSGDNAKIYGTLTVKGISKAVVLDAKLNKMNVSPITDMPTVGFSATTEIKRSDFNMSTLVPALGDEVPLTIEVEANRAADTKPGANPATTPATQKTTPIPAPAA